MFRCDVCEGWTDKTNEQFCNDDFLCDDCIEYFNRPEVIEEMEKIQVVEVSPGVYKAL